MPAAAILAHPLTLRILNVLGYAGCIVSNALSASAFESPKPSDPSNGNGTAFEKPDQTAIAWIVPARYAFSIWGVIYTMLLGFSIVQLLPWSWKEGWEAKAFQGMKEVVEVRVGYLFVLSCALNAFWLFCFTHEYHVLSFFVILGLLANVFGIYYRVHPISRNIAFGVSTIDQNANESTPLIGDSTITKPDGLLSRIFVGVTFGLYAGWLLCATTVSIFTVFCPIETSNPLATITTSIIALILLSIVALSILTTFQDLTIPLVAVWALTAIPHNGASLKYPEGAWYIKVTAESCAAVVGLGIGILFVLRVAARSRRFLARQ
ncbi:hypothetical protein HDU97_004424 [Phlyctochytrium planicorne]|nr:hypothetical protein HDU97_004424 [Phlyctochytrium planicorne]